MVNMGLLSFSSKMVMTKKSESWWKETYKLRETVSGESPHQLSLVYISPKDSNVYFSGNF